MPRLSIVLLALLLVVGSSYYGFYRGIIVPSSKPQERVPTEVDAFARQYIETLRANGLTGVEPLALSGTLAPSTRADVQKAADFLKQLEGTPLTLTLIEYVHEKTDVENVSSSKLTYQIEGQSRWPRIAIGVVDASGQKKVSSVNMSIPPMSIQEENAFKLRGKPLQAYVILAVAVIVPIFVLYVLFLLVFQSEERLLLRAVWAVCIVSGVGTITLDWHTGKVTTRPTAIRFPAIVTVSRPSLYSHLYLTISCPLGALIYFRRPRQSRVSAPTAQDPALQPVLVNPTSHDT